MTYKIDTTALKIGAHEIIRKKLNDLEAVAKESPDAHGNLLATLKDYENTLNVVQHYIDTTDIIIYKRKLREILSEAKNPIEVEVSQNIR